MQQSEQHTKFPIASLQKITIAAITWNLFGSLPPDSSLAQLFSSPRLDPLPDLIFFGTQECERSLVASFCCEAKELWQNMLAEHCKSHFLVATQTMRGLHIAILVRRQLRDYFQLERKEKMRAGGPCSLMGNKGAISLEFSLLAHSFQFINCHLAANQEETHRRNVTIARILQEVALKDEVIFLGDFNYRIEMEKNAYKREIQGRPNTEEEMKYLQKWGSEQLTNQKELADFLNKFQEGAITFPPTYKIGVNNGEYNPDRIPGWTDRIFHKKGGKMTRLRYFCQYDILGSDHRPVIACYQRPIDEQAMTFQSQNFVGVNSGQKCQLI